MDNGDTKTTGGIREGTKRLAGEAIAGGRGGLDSAGGGAVRPAGAGCRHIRPLTPIPVLPLIPEELSDAQKGPSAQGFCPGSAEIRGPSSVDVPAPTEDLACPPKQARHAGRREGGAGAAWPPSSRCPASRRAREWRGRGLPGRGHTRPRARRPPAGSPDRPQPARPRPGGWGLGRGRSQARGRCQVAPVTVTCRGVGGASTQVAYFRK